jgi:hypothetical protein
MYVYVSFSYLNAFVCVSVCMRTCIYEHAYEYVYVYVNVYAYACEFLCEYLYAHMHEYEYVHRVLSLGYRLMKHFSIALKILQGTVWITYVKNPR